MKQVIQSRIAFERLVEDALTYSVISKMTFEEYKDFLFYFFTEVYKLKENGLRKEDVEPIISQNYSDVLSTSDDEDIMFVRRFEVFNEELLEFCSSPFFWKTSLETYLKKWDRLFDIDWFKEV